MNEAENIKVIRRYFDGCNSGDLDVLLSTLAPDVVHYFLPPDRATVRGAEHLAKHWRKAKHAINPVWTVDHVIAQGDEVVTEWSCLWSPPGEQRRLLTRGTEWYLMRDGRIAEIRAYYREGTLGSSELADFPYGERGYLTRPD
jgi:ketosteroid isomerase-like protein